MTSAGVVRHIPTNYFWPRAPETRQILQDDGFVRAFVQGFLEPYVSHNVTADGNVVYIIHGLQTWALVRTVKVSIFAFYGTIIRTND